MDRPRSPFRVEPDGTVHFRYLNYRGEIQGRRVRFHRGGGSLHWGSTGHYPEEQWLLEAWDLDRGAWRTFALVNILGTEPEGTIMATDATPRSDSAPTFDQVDAHVRAIDPATFAPAAAGTRALPNPAEALRQVGAAYRAVRPILAFVRPFVPGAWRIVFDGFTTALDALPTGA